MATGSVSPRTGKVVDIPANAPTIGTPTDGGDGTTALVAYTAADTSIGGPIFRYTATSNPGSLTGTGTTSPISITGLTAGTAYTFTVFGSNPTGNSPVSNASSSLTLANPPAFESIATVNFASNTNGNATFTSIPGTYKHLQLRVRANNLSAPFAGNMNLYMTMNNDSASNYTAHTMYSNLPSGNISAADFNSNASMNFQKACLNYTSTPYNYFAYTIIDIYNYANTSIFKSAMSMSGGFDFSGNATSSSNNGMSLDLNTWKSTSAITRLDLSCSFGAWGAGCSVSLYGIK